MYARHVHPGGSKRGWYTSSDLEQWIIYGKDHCFVGLRAIALESLLSGLIEQECHPPADPRFSSHPNSRYYAPSFFSFLRGSLLFAIDQSSRLLGHFILGHRQSTESSI